jgi:hypothetical protein
VHWARGFETGIVSPESENRLTVGVHGVPVADVVQIVTVAPPAGNAPAGVYRQEIPEMIPP